MLGNFFASLAFASAFVSMISLFLAEREEGLEQKSWERLGLASFGLHALSILGVISTLFYLIYTHQYQFHYVWSHSSNELPVYYMISCFWEGQEGSFLLWCFWHSVLGVILMRVVSREWRGLVLGVIASIELVLSSMILGVYVGESWVYGIYLLLGMLPLGYFIFRYVNNRAELPWKGNFALAAIFVSALMLVTLFRGQSGFGDPWGWSDMVKSFDGFAFGMSMLGLLAFGVMYILYTRRVAGNISKHILDLISGASIFGVAYAVMNFDLSTWKVGSSPFLLLKEAFPNNPVYATDPDFVPTNGSGLNSLLQNYWMVIHPPTLFLGFASTVIPFAFVIAGLIKGKYREWIRPATPWMLFSAMILGVGIIMGGYWAYETLNFGGYWNWDPVENGSLVPWICGVAALHGMLIHKKTKSYLKLTMILVISTFWLVLYSTFLTRSGILGDTSVHTFTDLGLSGQLILLMAIYGAVTIILMVLRWKSIPTKIDQSKVWSAEFMLFMGILILLFSGSVIALATSIPVFNKIFGTSFAPPAEVQFFYYEWNVWFAIGFGIFSGIAQYLWWSKAKKKSAAQALYRPFLIAMVLGCVILAGLILGRKEFAFDPEFADVLEKAEFSSNFFAKIIAYLEFGIMSIADEMLLFSSLFVIFANGDVLLSLLKKNKTGLKVMGGTVTHIGFGMMLIGILFSSGYDEVISINLTPEEMQGFTDDEKVDNVGMLKGKPRMIRDYEVTYTGRKRAKAPIRKLKVIEETPEFFKVRFRDSTNDEFGFVLPRPVFLVKEEGEENTENEKSVHHTSNAAVDSELEGELDMQYVEDFLNKNLDLIKPPHINNRMLYGLNFRSLKDSSSQFILYPEAEVNEQMNGLIAHPARKIYWDRDIYVHVSQIPAEDDQEPEYKFHELALKPGDTTFIGKTKIYFHNIANLAEQTEIGQDFEIALAAHLLAVVERDTFFANPMYFIAKDNSFSMKQATIDDLHLDFAFYKVDPQKELFYFQVRELENPTTDYIAFKAIQKPYINLLWLGTFILTFGFLIAIYRRFKEV